MPKAGKKRYQVTLTEENVVRFQNLSITLNLPVSSMSLMLDDMLRNVVGSMEKLTKKGNVSLADMFKVIGEQLEEEDNYDKEKALAKKKK